MATTNPAYGKQTPYHLKLSTAVNQLIALWTLIAVIYQVIVATEDNKPAETYVGPYVGNLWMQVARLSSVSCVLSFLPVSPM